MLFPYVETAIGPKWTKASSTEPIFFVSLELCSSECLIEMLLVS